MDTQQLLELYDQYERRDLEPAGGRREVAGGVIRHVGPPGEEGFIAYAALTETDADTAIRQQLEYFAALGRAFEWKCYSHDAPADLLERLKAHGFTVGEREALLVLDVTALPDGLSGPVNHDLRRLTRADEVEDVIVIEEEVWRRDHGWLAARLSRDLHERPDALSVYVAYVDGVPASAAWTYFREGSCFAGLWGGTTRSAFRGRGLYKALVAARAQEALTRGVDFLSVDASPMSRPILETLGFRWLSDTHPCVWHP